MILFCQNIFPGFIIPLGSKAVFMFFMVVVPTNPASSSRSDIFPRPIPCSPVQVPPAAIARLKIIIVKITLILLAGQFSRGEDFR